MLKLQKNFMKRRIQTVDDKYMGPEPTWEMVDERTSDYELDKLIETALRWYQHFYDFKQSLSFIEKFYKKNKVDRKNLKKISANNAEDLLSIGRTPGFLCKMKLNGLIKLSVTYNDILIKRLSIIEEVGKLRKQKQKETKVDTPVISVQQRIKQKAESYIFDIDYVVDLFIDNNFETSFTFKAFNKINQVKKPVAQKMLPMIQDRIDELENKDEDPDLKEAYRHLTKRNKNRIIKLLKECKSGCEEVVATKQKKVK